MKKIEITGTNTLGGEFSISYGYGDIANIVIKIFNNDGLVIFEVTFPEPSKDYNLPPPASNPPVTPL